MRQASWIAFLLLTVGLLSYEASVQGPDAASNGDATPVAAEGGGDVPRPNN